MKKSDLYREWARVLDMCEGTGVDPNTCWKISGRIQNAAPYLTDNPEIYTLAVAILEGKPVFPGDRIWSIFSCRYVTVDKTDIGIIDSKRYSWKEPKRVFTLNGRKMPCPIRCFNGLDGSEIAYGFYVNDTIVQFKSEEDRNLATQVLIEILTENVK